MSEKEALLPTNRIFGDCCRNTGHFLCGVERIKRFVNVHVHCVVSNLKRISKMSTLHPLEKILLKPMFVRECSLYDEATKSKNRHRMSAGAYPANMV